MPTIFIFIILFMIKFCTPKINKKYIVSKVKRENLELFVDMKGTVVANNVTKIGLDVNLSVDDVYFKAGDFVKKGDIIVKFSDYQKSDVSEKREGYLIQETFGLIDTEPNVNFKLTNEKGFEMHDVNVEKVLEKTKEYFAEEKNENEYDFD